MHRLLRALGVSVTVIVALLAMLSPPTAHAQAPVPPTPAGPHAAGDESALVVARVSELPVGDARAIPPALRDASADGGSRRAPLWAPLASLVVPGAGQLAMRQARGVAYAVAEAYAALQVVEAARTARARRSEYRRIALEVGRKPYGGGPEATWTYYENIYDFRASGQYSLTSGAVLTPEPDANTFNGAQWLKAREIYWDDPDVPPPTSDPRYQRAIAFYEKNAWRDPYLWTFEDHLLDWNLYRSTIVRENQATRELTATLGIMIANHLLSAVDGLTSVRLRRTSGSRGEGRIEAALPWPTRRSPRWR